MSKIKFTTSHDGYTYIATSENAANKFAEKKGLGSVFSKGRPTKEELAEAKKVAANVWLVVD